MSATQCAYLSTTGKVVALSALLTVVIVAVSAVLIRKATAGEHDVDKLLFVHAIWRHGARSPTNCYPTDPYCGKAYWPDGQGVQSNEGKRQQFELGKWLRRRYADFLPERYVKKDIHVVSMDSDRMLTAAYLTLAGLYPPVGDQQWMDGLPWQPIPVSSVPASLGYLIGFPFCKSPEWTKEFLTVMETPEVQELITARRSTIEYVKKWAKFPNTTLTRNGTWLDIWQMEIMRNNLIITDHNNLTLPKWAQPLLRSPIIEEISLLKYVLPVSTASLARYSVGHFMDAILRRSQAKFEGKEKRLMWGYSVREINQIGLMKVLGVFDDIRPSFSAVLLIEMRLDHDGDPCLEFFYKHSINEPDAKQLNIPSCGYKCKVRTLQDMFAAILPSGNETYAMTV